MALKRWRSVGHIFGALLLAISCIQARAHIADAHSAPEIPQVNVPIDLVAGAVVRTAVENRVTNVATVYVALRGDDGQRVTLRGAIPDGLQTGAWAEAIGWRNGSTLLVSDSRTVTPARAQAAGAQGATSVDLEGTLLLAHLDFFESGRGDYLFMLRDDAGHVTRLNLAGGEALEPGMRIIARGPVSSDGVSLDVEVLSITAPPAPSVISQGRPIGQAASNNVLVVLVKFTDSPASDPFTQAAVQDVMTNATNGVAQYYSEVSYGQQTLNVTVTNWIVGRDPTTHALMATPPLCDFNTVGVYADTAAADAGYVGAYQNRFYVMPRNSACGGWAGLAYVDGSTAWSNGYNQLSVYAHELGHNFNLYHAASLQCSGGASIGGSCGVTEYGDPFDVMGNISAMHFSAVQKAKLNWIPAGTVRTHSSGTQQYTLNPLEIAGGAAYAVKIPVATNPNRTYWIEYRQPIGFDSGLPGPNGAQIRVANPFEFNCSGCLPWSVDTELLDMTAVGSPGNFNDAALAVGQTFTDSTSGITVQVVSADSAQLVVNVTAPGGGIATTISLTSSLNPSVVGNGVTFTASVTGNAPTGTVTFTDGGSTIAGCGAVPLAGAGNIRSAACSTSTLSAATHTIAAAYSGDAGNGASGSSAIAQVVNKVATTTSLVSSANPSAAGTMLTLTAQVTGSAPTGTVSFADGGAVIVGCSAVALTGVGNTRTALCNSSALSAGMHTIVATYSGNVGNTPSSSGPMSQMIGGPPLLTNAASRRVHGGAGTFDLPLSAVATNPTTEPRQGPSQTIVFTFDKPITAANAAVTEGTAIAAAPSFIGNDVIVNLTGVANAQYVTVALFNVSATDGSTDGVASVRIGFLLGDVSQNRVVTLADLGRVGVQLAQPVTAANYLNDVNASGTLSIADMALANSKLTTSLPAP